MTKKDQLSFHARNVVEFQRKCSSAQKLLEENLGGTMKQLKLALFSSLICFSSIANATPLSMNYAVSVNSIEDGSARFTYNIQLILDNHDGSWTPGQYFNIIIYGDSLTNADSLGRGAFVDFKWEMPGLTVGVLNSCGAGGGHNGPCLQMLNKYDGWRPDFSNPSLNWRISSANFLGQGQFLWSNLWGDGVAANFEVANLASYSLPEPSSEALILLGIFGIAALKYKRSRTAGPV